ncbi:hypothetical protein [Paenibacillus pinihumi]|uniref:hypothetical protein n=1 Tax=Paenibacillus pinihumi TaxID=669462 RepID=UPI000429C718|nr:hypothetical protein [Paenibacillus pinihumi]
MPFILMFMTMLIIVVGLQFIIRGQRKQAAGKPARYFQWLGYSLIAMSLLLIFMGVLQVYDEAQHAIGH